MAAAVAASPSSGSSSCPVELLQFMEELENSFTSAEKNDLTNLAKDTLGGNYTEHQELGKVLKQFAVDDRVTLQDVSLIEKIFAEASENKDEIKSRIEHFKKENNQNESWRKGDDFVGRHKEKKEISELISNKDCVNLYGPGGVGKTRLAKEVIHDTQSHKLPEMKGFEYNEIQFRSVFSMRNVFKSFLSMFGYDSIDYDKARVIDYVSKLKDPLLLILDNLEEIIEQKKSEFVAFLDEIIAKSANKLKLILTSREAINDESIEDHLIKPLSDDEANELAILETDLSQNQSNLLVSRCNNKALFIRASAGTLKDGSVDADEFIKKLRPDNEQLVLQQVFNTFTDTLKNVCISLCLFPRQFSLDAACKIIGCSLTEGYFYLQELCKYRHWIDSSFSGAESYYEIHSTIQAFLKPIGQTEKYLETFKRAEERFVKHFVHEVQCLARLMDKDFIDAYTKFEDDRPNFELSLSLSWKHEFLLFSPEHGETTVIASLISHMLDPEVRVTLFHEWAALAESQGNHLWSCDFTSLESIHKRHTSPQEAYEIMELAQAKLDAIQRKQGEQFNLSLALCKYAKGVILIDLWLSPSTRTSEKRKMLNDAGRALEDSLRRRKHILFESTEITSTLNWLATVYQKQCRYREAHPYFIEAYEMRKRLSEGSHADIPVFLQDIGTSWENFNDDRKALECYEEALKIEKEMDVYGNWTTATIHRNMAYCYYRLSNYDRALEHGEQALIIRNKVLGKHFKTAQAFYLVGLMNYHLIGTFGSPPKLERMHAALDHYEQGYKMEESLSWERHSRDRYRLRDGIRYMLLYFERITDDPSYYERLVNYCEEWAEIDRKDAEREKQREQTQPEEVPLPFNEEDGISLYKKTVDKHGKMIDFCDAGISIHFPEDAVNRQVTILCKVLSKETLNLNVEAGKDQVKSICQLHIIPPFTVLLKPVRVYMSHYGPVKRRKPGKVVQIPPSEEEYFEVVMQKREYGEEYWHDTDTTQITELADLMSTMSGNYCAKLPDIPLPAIMTTIHSDIKCHLSALCQVKTDHFSVSSDGVKYNICQIPWPKIQLTFPSKCVDVESKFTAKAWSVEDRLPVFKTEIGENSFISPVINLEGKSNKTFHQPVSLDIDFADLHLPWLSVPFDQEVSMYGMGYVLCQDGEGPWEDVSEYVRASVTNYSNIDGQCAGIRVRLSTDHFSNFLCVISNTMLVSAKNIPRNTISPVIPYPVRFWSLIVQDQTDYLLKQVMSCKRSKMSGVEGTPSERNIHHGEDVYFSVFLRDKEGPTLIEQNQHEHKICFNKDQDFTEHEIATKASNSSALRGSVVFKKAHTSIRYGTTRIRDITEVCKPTKYLGWRVKEIAHELPVDVLTAEECNEVFKEMELSSISNANDDERLEELVQKLASPQTPMDVEEKACWGIIDFFDDMTSGKDGCEHIREFLRYRRNIVDGRVSGQYPFRSIEQFQGHQLLTDLQYYLHVSNDDLKRHWIQQSEPYKKWYYIITIGKSKGKQKRKTITGNDLVRSLVKAGYEVVVDELWDYWLGGSSV